MLPFPIDGVRCRPYKLEVRMRNSISQCCVWLLLFLTVCPASAAPLAVPPLPDRPGGAAALPALLRELAGLRGEVIAMQRELVSRPALSPQDKGDGEEAKARWIEGWLHANGLPEAERVDVPDARVPSGVRPNLVIRYAGAVPRTLWIVSHLDVSPPGALSQWTGSPWRLRVEKDMLYGRGVGDKHNIIVSALLLMKTLARLRVTPPISLGVVLCSGEKADLPPVYGLSAVLETMPGLFSREDFIVVAGRGDSRAASIEVAEKGLLWLKIAVSGASAHAAEPQRGANALTAAAKFITALEGLHQRFPAANGLFRPPHSTFVPTRSLPDDIDLNQIPDEFVFYLDCRFLPPYTPDEVQDAVRLMADLAERENRVRITLERVHSRNSLPPTPADAPVVRRLAKAVKAQYGAAPDLTGLGLVSQAFDVRSHGLPAAVWSNAASVSMAANEHVSVASHLEAAAIFARMLFDGEGAASPPARP